jgi:excisionase family DNA binding protein
MSEEFKTTGAMSIKQFREEYGVGHTKFYELLKAGELAARKMGRKTLIERSEAERWLRSLPTIEVTAPAPKWNNYS